MSSYSLKYNAPISLTFSLLCTLVAILNQTVAPEHIVSDYFVVGGQGQLNLRLWTDYIQLFSYVLGHLDWNHLISNLTIILLLGPILEEKYGSKLLLWMIIVTAVVNGIINVLLFTTAVAGASGIVFMMILLASFTNIKSGEIPMTFLLIAGLYLSKEVIGMLQKDGISQLSHLMGGICGSFFGFSYRRKHPLLKSKKNQDSANYQSVI